DSLGRYFDEVLSRRSQSEEAPLPQASLVDLAGQEMPDEARELIGSYLPSAHLLGQRTGELHMALASERKDAAFLPEPFTAFYRRSLYQSLRTLTDQALSLLKKRLPDLPQALCPGAEQVLSLESAIFDLFRQLLERKITAMRIRCHGDFHLGQVLFTGKDFVIIDFEGEPARPISERRLKRSPLRDIAGMLRSFNYAALTKLRGNQLRPEDTGRLKPWAAYWDLWVSVNYLKGFLEATSEAAFLPKSREELSLMVDIYLLEKAIYELSYELNNRPDWIAVPIEGILELLRPSL
ncbi:MAG TPA: phosphotransferase, partial [Terriglobales bacterium]|nr:phosphotransferase [Terriglobales bacterium]